MPSPQLTAAAVPDLRRQERELVAAMLGGDERAFERFADDYLPRLYRFAAARLGGDRELIREIVQTTVCKAIARLATFRGEAGLYTWLCACCRNEIALHYRRRGRAPRFVEWDDGSASQLSLPAERSAASPEDAVLAGETRQLVHVALDELPDRYARALEWKYLDRLPVREIARRLAVTPKAAESLLGRARRAFQDAYQRLAGRSSGPIQRRRLAVQP